MFFIGGLPALLALFVRFRVKESKVWEKTKAESWTHLGRGIVAQWRLFLYLVALMTAMVAVAHGTQDMYPTFLKVERGFSAQTVAKIAVVYNVGALIGGIVLRLRLRPLRPPLHHDHVAPAGGAAHPALGLRPDRRPGS
jgi:SHS family lactate transporter-like MFS transporter